MALMVLFRGIGPTLWMNHVLHFLVQKGQCGVTGGLLLLCAIFNRLIGCRMKEEKKLLPSNAQTTLGVMLDVSGDVAYIAPTPHRRKKLEPLVRKFLLAGRCSPTEAGSFAGKAGISRLDVPWARWEGGNQATVCATAYELQGECGSHARFARFPVNMWSPCACCSSSISAHVF